MHESDDLTPQERAALDAMHQEAPPVELENRVVDALAARGAVRRGSPMASPDASSRWSPGNLAAAAAAAVVCIALGAFGALYLAGSAGPVAPAGDAPAGDIYVLLLHSGPGEFELSAAEESQRVQEYSAWAGELAMAGRLLAGEKLADEARMLAVADAGQAARLMPADRGDGILAGYFLIRADDYDEAVNIAADCPHLRYGGRVEVRRIEPT